MTTTNPGGEPFGEAPQPKAETKDDPTWVRKIFGPKEHLATGALTSMANLQADLAVSSVFVKAMKAVRSGNTKALDADLLHLLQTDEETAARVLAVLGLLEKRYDAAVRRLAALERMAADEGEPLEPAGEQRVSKHGDESWLGAY